MNLDLLLAAAMEHAYAAGWQDAMAARDRSDAAKWAPMGEHLQRILGEADWTELRQRRQHQEPHRLQATPGWPPIAIPGQPGKLLLCTEKRPAA